MAHNRPIGSDGLNFISCICIHFRVACTVTVQRPIAIQIGIQSVSVVCHSLILVRVNCLCIVWSLVTKRIRSYDTIIGKISKPPYPYELEQYVGTVQFNRVRAVHAQALYSSADRPLKRGPPPLRVRYTGLMPI